MRIKAYKSLFTAGITILSLFLVFTISVNAAVSISAPDAQINYTPSLNRLYVSSDETEGVTATPSLGSGYYHQSVRNINGVDFNEDIFEYSSYLNSRELGDDLPVYDVEVSSWSRIAFDGSHFSNLDIYDGYYFSFYFYLYMDDSDGVQIVPYRSQVYTGNHYLDCSFDKVYETWVTPSTSIEVYQAYVQFDELYLEWDDGHDVFYIRNFASSLYGSVGTDSWIYSGVSSVAGFYKELPQVDWYGSDNPSGDNWEPADPSVQNGILNNQNKLDYLENNFNTPSPDIDSALDNLSINNLNGIAGFFQNDSRFNAFLTSLMAVGVSFGLVGYVLHGKK